MSGEPLFSGLRIVEFGQFVSVPFCAELLANGGAEEDSGGILAELGYSRAKAGALFTDGVVGTPETSPW